MRLVLLVLLAFGPGCSLYFPGSSSSGSVDGGTTATDGDYTFSAVRSIAGEHTVAGVDSDGAGGLWIVYRDPTGSYYDLANVWVTHLDANGTKLSEWQFHDEYTTISGIAYTGDAVWISYNSEGGVGNDHLRKLDPQTGATIGTFGTEAGIVDLSWRPGALLLSNQWNQVLALDPSTGGELWSADITAFGPGGTMRGIAAYGDKMWVISWDTNEAYLVDDTGALHGRASLANVNSNPASSGVDDGLQLASDGSGLILVHENQITWMSVHAN